MNPDRVAHVHQLCERLTEKTRLCETLAAVLPVDTPRSALLGRLRELAEDHLAFGSALRRLVDEAESEGEACAV